MNNNKVSTYELDKNPSRSRLKEIIDIGEGVESSVINSNLNSVNKSDLNFNTDSDKRDDIDELSDSVNCNDDSENDTDDSNWNNRGKFSDRLKKIRRDRVNLKKRKKLFDNELPIITIVRNIGKIILVLPSIVYTHVVDRINSKDKKEIKKNLSDNDMLKSALNIDIKSEENITDDILLNMDIDKYVQDIQKNKKIKVDRIRDLDIKALRKKKEYLVNKHRKNMTSTAIINEEKNKLNEKDIKKKALQKEVVDLIQKKFVMTINELEILQSELYVLKELNTDDLYLFQCQQDIKEIKKILSKVKFIKEKYNYLKDNVDFQFMLEYDDDLLIDKILELKELCSVDELKSTIDDYKILDEYKYLYLKIDKFEENIIRYSSYKSKKAKELEHRDVHFEQLLNDVYSLDTENERYNTFVENQNRFLNDLNNKISNIESHEQVNYRLKGFNQLLGNSFKYLGLLVVNPLKGLIPGIATQTLITKNVIHNLYNTLEWEENREVVYDAINYSMDIEFAINNLDETSLLVDSTLEEIINLKKKYELQFSRYEKNFSIYKDTIKKLDKIQDSILDNKLKIDFMKIKMKENELINNNKLNLVKRLNTSNNN